MTDTSGSISTSGGKPREDATLMALLQLHQQGTKSTYHQICMPPL